MITSISNGGIHPQLGLGNEDVVFQSSNEEWFTPLVLASIATASLTLYLATSLPLATILVLSAASAFAVAKIADAIFIEMNANSPTTTTTITTITSPRYDGELSAGINPTHFRKSLELRSELPDAPFGVDLGESYGNRGLVHYFNRINFTDPSLDTYVDPGSLRDYQDDGTVLPLTIIDLRASIRTLTRELNRRDNYRHCAPPRYNRLCRVDTMLKHVLNSIQQGEVEENVQASILQQIAISARHCVGRQLSVATESYERTAGAVVVTTMKDQIREKFHEIRKGVLQSLVATFHADVRPEEHAHVWNEYNSHVGELRGIRGFDLLREEGRSVSHVSRNVAIDRFDAIYTKEFILDRLDKMVNGEVDEEGNRIERFDGARLTELSMTDMDDFLNVYRPRSWLGRDRGEYRMEFVYNDDLTEISRHGLEQILIAADILSGNDSV